MPCEVNIREENPFNMEKYVLPCSDTSSLSFLSFKIAQQLEEISIMERFGLYYVPLKTLTVIIQRICESHILSSSAH